MSGINIKHKLTPGELYVENKHKLTPGDVYVGHKHKLTPSWRAVCRT